MKKRYLTKSRFKLAMECPTKIFYTGKPKYANQKLEDSFLLALADGGFQVGELAKYYFPGGYEIETLNYEQAIIQTNNFLKHDNVIIYEAAITAENLFIRSDILVKNGNHLKLYEVKSKSYDPTEKDTFYNRNDTLKAKWKPYLYDVAFQKHVIKLAFPEYIVSAYLMLADKTTLCPSEGLNQKFRLEKDANGRKKVVVSSQLNENDLKPHILRAVNVDAECDLIYTGEGKGQHNISFSESVKFLAAHYAIDKKIHSTISTACGKCEFYTTELEEQNGFLNGKKECWKKQLGWGNDDFSSATIFDLWNYRSKEKFIETNIIKLSDLSEEDIKLNSSGKPGLSNSERQRLQIKKYKEQDNSTWLDYNNLKHEMQSWIYPLHFIDFETTMTAIPFNRNRRPYEGTAFQFSHHIVYANGQIEHRGQYLNTTPGFFPNYEFIRRLKAELDQDSGSIFRYGDHENTYLNGIYQQLLSDTSEIKDLNELCTFIKLISKLKL